MNRQQRRAAGLRAEKMRQRINRDPELNEAYHQGFDTGFIRASSFTWRMCFAAVAKTLHGLKGYEQDDIVDFLRQLDETMTTELTSEEVIDEVLEETGIILNFDEWRAEDRIEGVKS